MATISVAGVSLASGAAEIRYRGRDDLVLVALAPGSQCAATFTRNAFRAAPVLVAEAHLAAAAPRYWLINAGNANAGTGVRGLEAARTCCHALADVAGVAAETVLPFSTGVIGEELPVARITAALPALHKALAPTGWERAARAIMTTDTVPKQAVRQVSLGARTATLVGIAKGAGMICPDMATMLAFLATDAAVAPDALRRALHQAVADSFNCISIDGDTSTNDACVVAATGALGQPPLTPDAGADWAAFSHALTDLCQELATAIVRDGEGATKLARIEVSGARTAAEARQVAAAVAHSPLVKTALHAGDPNWGRILAAVGRAGLAGLVLDGVGIWLDEVAVVTAGARAPDYDDAAGRAVLAQPEFTIRIALGRGDARARLLTCDLSCDYVRINAAYRT